MGSMVAYGYGPAPCDYDWGPGGECAVATWPCKSGACGKLEYCQDDTDFLVSLIPSTGTWTQTTMLEQTKGVGEKVYETPLSISCAQEHCMWRLAKVGPAGSTILFEMRLDYVYTLQDTPIPDATNVMMGQVPLSAVDGIWVNGTAIEPSSLTLYWFPDRHDDPHPDTGLSGAVVIRTKERVTTTVAWIARSGDQFDLGIHTSPIRDVTP